LTRAPNPCILLSSLQIQISQRNRGVAIHTRRPGSFSCEAEATSARAGDPPARTRTWWTTPLPFRLRRRDTVDPAVARVHPHRAARLLDRSHPVHLTPRSAADDLRTAGKMTFSTASEPRHSRRDPRAAPRRPSSTGRPVRAWA
jgi:hypothetical protein